MKPSTTAILLVSVALLMVCSACGEQALEGPRETAPPQETPTVPSEPAATATTAAVPTAEEAPPTPAAPAEPEPTAPPPEPPAAATQDWATFCQPSPEEEGKLVANLPMDSTVELDAYLYVKSFASIRDNMMPFTLRGIPYQSGDATWSDACQVHLLIPFGTGPNHVGELPEKFQMGEVVVWDSTGREIRGWQRNLDSYHVRVVGVVVRAYGGDTGLDGSNTLRLEELQLLEG